MLMKFTIEILEIAHGKPVAILRAESEPLTGVQAKVYDGVEEIFEKIKQVYDIIEST